MSRSSFSRGVAQVHRAWNSGKHRQALQLVDELLKSWPENPSLLVLRAELIQSADFDDAPPLNEAKDALVRAVELNPDAAEPRLELAHFLFAVEDNRKEAIKHFDEAQKICERQLRETLTAKAKALAELGRKEEALKCLAQALLLERSNGHNGSPEAKKILKGLEELVHVS